MCVRIQVEFCINRASYDQHVGGENGLRGAQTYLADDIKTYGNCYKTRYGICILCPISAIKLEKTKEYGETQISQKSPN